MATPPKADKPFLYGDIQTIINKSFVNNIGTISSSTNKTYTYKMKWTFSNGNWTTASPTNLKPALMPFMARLSKGYGEQGKSMFYKMLGIAQY